MMTIHCLTLLPWLNYLPARSPIAIEEALPLFQQIAEGLEAAHDKGVIRRDLKPANIKVTPGGKPKILDFGLAKVYGEEVPEQNLSESPTATRGTATGVILGTAPYMSPEQARGKVVDKRTDVWAFGCCLYEALTGTQAFLGETVSDTMAAILKNEPDWERLPAGTPAPVRNLLRRCLRKDPDRRPRDIGGARIEMEDAQSEPADTAPPTRRSLSPVLAALAASVVTAIVVWSLMRSGAPVPERAVQVTSAADVENFPTWSPDGGRLAYESNQSGNWDIWVIQLGGGEPVNLTADHPGDDRFPSWSPEGHQIAFLSQRGDAWGLYTLSALGGRPRKLISLAPLDLPLWGAPQWSADGKEIAVSFRSSGKNVADIVSAQSQDTRRVMLPVHTENMTPDLSWSPDGRHFAYVEALMYNAEVARLWVLPSSGGEPVPVTDGMTNDWNPTWSRDGRHLFFVSNRAGSMDLWRQPMGERVSLAATPSRSQRGWRSVPPLFRRTERSLPIREAVGSTTATSGGYPSFTIARRPGLTPSNSHSTTPLSSSSTCRRMGGASFLAPTVQDSRDGRWLGFEQSGSFYRLPTSGQGEPELIVKGPGQTFRWSPDAKKVYFTGSGDHRGKIWALSLEDAKEYAVTDLTGRRGSLSFNLAMDGQYLYFHWVEDVADIWVMDAAR